MSEKFESESVSPEELKRLLQDTDDVRLVPMDPEILVRKAVFPGFTLGLAFGMNLGEPEFDDDDADRVAKFVVKHEAVIERYITAVCEGVMDEFIESAREVLDNE